MRLPDKLIIAVDGGMVGPTIGRPPSPHLRAVFQLDDQPDMANAAYNTAPVAVSLANLWLMVRNIVKGVDTSGRPPPEVIVYYTGEGVCVESKLQIQPRKVGQMNPAECPRQTGFFQFILRRLLGLAGLASGLCSSVASLSINSVPEDAIRVSEHGRERAPPRPQIVPQP